MVKTIISFACLFFAVGFVHSQTPATTPPPPPPPRSTPPPQPVTISPQQAASRAMDLRRMQPFPLNRVSESDLLAARVVALQRIVAPLYRKPTDKEMAALTVDDAALTRYSQFLKLEETGIFRLVPDTGCEHNERVISAREDCIKFSIPGSGNSFSFRNESYRLRHLADITFTGGKLRITGIYMHGILTELGETPIEMVSLATPGLKPLTSFRPSVTADDVLQVDSVIERGLTDGKFTYSKEVVPKSGVTYAMRSVAYRGKVVRAAGGVRYNELDYDKRRDVIVVFHILQNDPQAGLTIVWRTLTEGESPKIRLANKDDLKTGAGQRN